MSNPHLKVAPQLGGDQTMQYSKILIRILKEFRLPTRPNTILLMNTILSFSKLCRNIFSFKDKKRESNERKGFAVYDLRYQPISFDIVHFLCCAEHYFNGKGINEFEVLIYAQMDRYYENAWKGYDQTIDRESQKLRIGNMIIPIVQMHKNCNSVILTEDIVRVKEECSKGFTIFPEYYDGVNLRSTDIKKANEAAKNCSPYSGLEAPSHALEIVNKFKAQKSIKNPLVSITIRNYGHQKPRNTNVEVALKFAKYLQEIGYTPIFVPDSENPFQTFAPYETFTPASNNMFYRMALYESCYTNFMANGGPSQLAFLNPKVSYVNYKLSEPEYEAIETMSMAALARQGVFKGDQLFVRDSWWEWGEETVDNLVKAFHIVENKKQMNQ
jgi:hypothetical protein